MIVALHDQGLEKEAIAEQLGIPFGKVCAVLNTVAAQAPENESEEITREEALELKRELLNDFRSSDDLYLRAKIGIELYGERPSARKLKEAERNQVQVNLTNLIQVLNQTNRTLIENELNGTGLRNSLRQGDPVIAEQAEGNPPTG